MPNRVSKIVIFNGSHRSEKGFTEIILRKFIEGAESAGAQCEVLYPAKNKIIPCESCGKCLFETPGICKFNDDMESIIQKMEEADSIIFACPVYFDSMPSSMKKLIERLRSTLDADFRFKNGRTYHIKSIKKEQKVLTIFTAGNPERESFTSISRVFSRIIDNMGYQHVGEIQFPASHLLVAEPEILTDQLEAVVKIGKEFALTGEIRQASLEEANREYIDDPVITLQHMTHMILEMRAENQRNKIEYL